MTEIRIFNNVEFSLQILPEGDSFTVAAPGLARALGHRHANHMLATVPDRDKGYRLVGTPGGQQEVWVVNEPGFYRVIARRQAGRVKDEMQRAQVERFQDWVFGEVLPAIRRTGRYEVGNARPKSDSVWGVTPPDLLTYDEVCAFLRQFCGVSLTVNELTRNLRAGGVLKQNGAPTKRFQHLFWFTGSCWNVQSHLIPQVAFRVYETGRELQDFRFLQARLELDGVGRPPSGSDFTHLPAPGPLPTQIRT